MRPGDVDEAEMAVRDMIAPHVASEFLDTCEELGITETESVDALTILR